MFPQLIGWDKSLLLFCNGCHLPWLDVFFSTLSARWTNILLVVPLLIFLFYRKNCWREALLVLAGIVVTVLLCDQFASTLCKPLFHRFRPTHDAEIGSLVRVLNDYRGGMYGFISSHAANTFGAAVFLLCVFRNRLFTVAILLWACLVSYSRIYLGVHFPGDILAGALSGVLFGYLIYSLYCLVRQRWQALRLASGGDIVYRSGNAATWFAAYILLMLFIVGVISALAV